MTIHVGPGSDIDGWGNRRALEYWDTRTQAWKTATGPRTFWVGSADARADLPLSGLPRPYSCVRPPAALVGPALGPVRLGMTRTQARRQFPGAPLVGRRYWDSFCTASNNIRVGYPSPRLLRNLPLVQRRRLAGRVALILTSSRHYALRGVRSGTRLARVPRLLRVGRPYKVGASTWYLVLDGSVRGVLKTRHGVVQEIGITNPVFGATPREARVFFTSFS